MKNIISTFLLFAFITSFSFSQNGDKWEAWAESLAAKAERIAERVSRDAERNAEGLAIAAENFAADMERKFDRGEFDIHINNWPKGKRFSSVCDAGYLGIHSDHISRKKAEKLGFQNKYGSYVSKVVKNSAAEKAGLQPFDYIYGVADQRTSDNQDLSDILSDYEPGTEVTLHYIRKGQQKTVNVKLGDYDEYEWDLEEDDHAFLGVRPADNERRDDMDGVAIEVIKNSTAEEMGLEKGDIIKAINGYPVLDWDDVTTAISNIEPGEKAEVIIKRGDSEITKSASLKSRENTYEDEGSFQRNNNWNWNWDNEDDEELASTGGAFLGVYIEKISDQKAKALGFDNPYGSYISGVLKNTAAEKAGIMPFDYIFGIDEYRVGVEQNLGGILLKYGAGDEADVHFYRKGKKMSKSVVFRPHADAKKESKTKCDDPFLGIIELDKTSGQTGIKVKPVSESTAMNIGLEEEDIVTHINGYQMYDWTDIGIAINMLAPGDKIQVDFVRDGNKKSASGKIMSYAETKKCKDCNCGEKNDFVFISPDIKIKIPNRTNFKGSDVEQRVDLSALNVNVENVSNDDARSLESKGVDMKVSNDLKVENLELSPNPNIGMFELQFDLKTEGETAVRVFNPAGRAIYEYELGRFMGDFSDYIDISQNGPGTYFLQISQNGKSFVRKIVLKNN